MVDSKSYAVRYQDKVRVVRSNVPPLSYISEVPEEISPSDYPFLKVSENDQGLTVIVDLESKHLFQNVFNLADDAIKSWQLCSSRITRWQWFSARHPV